MKHLLLTALLFIGLTHITTGQITITANDMPANGDTLRSSMANPLIPLDLVTTGANTSWDFSSLGAMSQTVDTFVSASSVNILYLILGLQAYGPRADLSAITGGTPLPIPISNSYVFFEKKTSPSRFLATGFGAEVNGIAAPIPYSDEDEWYFFPLDYGDHDSSTYALNFELPGFGGIELQGKRHTDVDGWGTIVTPYYTTPEQCIRTRSVGDEIDSVTLGTTTIGLPRKTIEYRWLTNSDHYPALWVTATEILGMETITSIRYRDHYRQLTSVGGVGSPVRQLNAYPNPVNGNVVTLDIPAQWKAYTVELFDITGKCLFAGRNDYKLDMSSFASGNYVARVISGAEIGMVKITK